MEILTSFRNTTGLKTNPVKSSVAAIRCDGDALDDVLENFGEQHVGLPMKYLGLPIIISWLLAVQL